ncbi:ribbon-helix-helix protein, CopG family [Clostridium paridis]|uniref:Ribbon-helix-helix protein, CopG family n=1 Tax=Clostridium paridis TaxID=2803863 RepID=A0A937FDZ6_9CLOT|nr:ribbon-helix-helix protein, CopG family [Clostridium paridis]MBL4932270.1 ribbon-helix-helix protein, CopG family [Clostridium paridis]
MPRIDIKDIDEETLRKLDEQCKKYGVKSRSDYIRLLIKMDIMTSIVERINKENK